MNISELNAGDRIVGQFLLADAKKGVKDNGAVYWTLILQDNSGTMEAKKWDYLPEDEETLVKGNVVQIDGEVLKYRTALQMKVRGAEKVDQSKVEWGRFIACAPMSTDTMKQKLDLCLSQIKDPDIARLAKALIDEFLEDLLVYPAAVRNHHDYLGGLLFHSLTMADMAVNVCRVYPMLNRDLVIAGVLIHDLGKTIELSGTKATAFTSKASCSATSPSATPSCAAKRKISVISPWTNSPKRNVPRIPIYSGRKRSRSSSNISFFPTIPSLSSVRLSCPRRARHSPWR